MEDNISIEKSKLENLIANFKIKLKDKEKEIEKLKNELNEKKRQNKILEEKIIKMDEEIIKQAQINEKLKEDIKNSLNTLNNLKEKLLNLSAKKENFKENIDDVLEIVNSSEKKLETFIDNSSINDIEVEMKVFLKGMFHKFIKEKNALEILIEGKSYYYPLSSYQCKHLPMSGSRVLVFKSEDNENIVFGFHGPRLIDIARKIKAEIKFASKSQNRLKLYIEEDGYINFYPNEEFWENNNYKIGDKIILTEINIEGDRYFYIKKKSNFNMNRLKVLEYLRKDE